MSQYSEGGYLCTTIWKYDKKKRFGIHRLVALAFVKNPNNLKCVKHKDGNRLNNNIENLEWSKSVK
jgi:hypothetical protein